MGATSVDHVVVHSNLRNLSSSTTELFNFYDDTPRRPHQLIGRVTQSIESLRRRVGHRTIEGFGEICHATLNTIVHRRAECVFTAIAIV
jgi:hypothetical protein